MPAAQLAQVYLDWHMEICIDSDNSKLKHKASARIIAYNLLTLKSYIATLTCSC